MSEEIKSLDEILLLTDSEYSEYVTSLGGDAEVYWGLDEIDDQLLTIVRQRPEEVERICKINSVAFETLPDAEVRLRLIGYNFNTRVIAATCRENPSDAKEFFKAGIEFCRKHKHYEAGKSISRNIFELWRLAAMPSDESLYFLMLIREFYEELGKHEDCVEVLCAAALHFGDAGAFQSAYRAIHDAQQIAAAQKSFSSQVRILETQGMVALAEGDLNCANDEFEKCFKICAHLGHTPSSQLRANAALVKMQRGEYGEARNLYEELLNKPLADADAVHRREMRINLLVCCRELSDSQAIQTLCQQIEADLEKFNLESRVEARLVLAKTYFAAGDLTRTATHLSAACFSIQERIDDYQRLHYRRGIRERYVDRVKTLLAEVDTSGNAEHVLPVLLFCNSNAILDWLAVLGWCDAVLESKGIPQEKQTDLKSKKEELIRFGTPFIFGPREKYDDPFELASPKAAQQMGAEVAKAADYSRPWRDFNDLTATICKEFDYPSPFEEASLAKSVERIRARLAAGSTFLFTYVCTNGCELFFVYGEQYLRQVIPLNSLSKFGEALRVYQRNGSGYRNDFRRRLDELEAAITPIMQSVVATLVNSDSVRLVLMSDMFTEGLPILPAILANEKMRARIKNGQFEFLTCPALWDERGDCRVEAQSVFLSNSEEKLECSDSERALVNSTFPPGSCSAHDLSSFVLDFSKPPLSSAKHLHLATHSVPVNLFSDPNFVSTSPDGQRESVWLESVQREAHNLQFKLVFLDGCNTGTTSNWNYYREFKTNEKVGLSSVFLLNRRCIVVATQWNEIEIASFVYSSLFYRHLKDSRNSVKAFAMALVDLYELDIKGAVVVFQGILSDSLREKRCSALLKSTSPHPFRSAYFIGMFQCHSLLFR
jgi:tetratricopeptide (TPR) repeat protein